ncbi:MAG TPA: heavy-metal-associated domain-containing protein [Bacteroidales bacterium]|nr:heavy-metal-associated domain-containing protein [Bacteroidales bacterium]
MKKQIARLFLLFAVFCFAGSVYGQTVQNIKEEKIKVTFHCPQGKTFVENGLKKSAGVIEAVADIETKIVAVKYVEGITNRKELVKVIENIGYTTEDSKTDDFINKDCPNRHPQSN